MVGVAAGQAPWVRWCGRVQLLQRTLRRGALAACLLRRCEPEPGFELQVGDRAYPLRAGRWLAGRAEGRWLLAKLGSPGDWFLSVWQVAAFRPGFGREPTACPMPMACCGTRRALLLGGGAQRAEKTEALQLMMLEKMHRQQGPWLPRTCAR
jgi:hypothetical protein